MKKAFNHNVKKLRKAAKKQGTVSLTYKSPSSGETTRKVVIKRVEKNAKKNYYLIYGVYNNVHKTFRSDRVISVRKIV